MSGRGRGRGKGGGRVKRQEVESEDGWTVITHGLSKLNVDGKTPKSKKHHESRIAGVLPSKTVHGLTADKLHSELKNLQERWRDTTVAKQVEDLVTEKKWDMKEALCIGIGSFSRDWENRHRSMWQLILFMDVIQNLNKEALVYAQDPAFTPLDIEFLQLLNITTLDTEIEKHITPESFLYSPFVDWFILLPTFLASKDPMLYVGNEILDDYSVYAQTEDKRAKLAECNELGKKFLSGRDTIKLKDFEAHAHALNGMVVYWKTSDLQQALEEVPA